MRRAGSGNSQRAEGEGQGDAGTPQSELTFQEVRTRCHQPEEAHMSSDNVLPHARCVTLLHHLKQLIMHISTVEQSCAAAHRTGLLLARSSTCSLM
jgi:hypothetical protein